MPPNWAKVKKSETVNMSTDGKFNEFAFTNPSSILFLQELPSQQIALKLKINNAQRPWTSVFNEWAYRMLEVH